MAYDQTGAAVGAAGHYASVITAAFVNAGVIGTTEDALDLFAEVLVNTFAACESLKGEQPEAAAPAKRSYPARKASGGSSGGDTQDPGTLEIRAGKHGGKTIAAVYAEDPDYLDWCVENLKNEFLRTRIESYLATV